MAEENSNVNGETEEIDQLKLCVLCATDLKDKSPKLLPCLHSLCENCLNSLFQLQVQQQTGDSSGTEGNNDKSEPKASTILCPACNCTVERSSVLDNLFISVENPIVIEEDEEEKIEDPICTGCDESQKVKATSFCTDCHEYLCDECVFAHKRVRMTKDHKIVPKDDAKKDDDSPDTSKQKMMYCERHKHEPLKLFCETCEKLTCRDCQLLEHKDHKYQFLQEAITQQRESLQNAVVSLKTKLANYKQANEILKNKHSELTKRMVDESENITKARDRVIEAFKKYSESLINHLEKYVKNKTTIISEKQTLVSDALLKLNQAVDFVENALTVGDDIAILYSKGAMIRTLKQLSESGIPFQPSFLNYSIRFENEIDILIHNQSKLGYLQIDGNWFPAKNATAPHTQTSGIHPSVSQQQHRLRLPNTQVPQMSQISFNAQLRDKIRNLPPEQQKIYEAKLREKYQMQQQHVLAQQQQGKQAQINRLQNHSSIQNQLTGPTIIRPNQHGVPNRTVPNPYQNNQFAMSAASHLAAISQRQSSSPNPPQYRPIVPAPPGMVHNQPNTFQHFSNISSVGGAQNGTNKAPNPVVSREKTWSNCRMATAENVTSPGAQAAAYGNKTPSPAGAGFDHQVTTQPSAAPIDQLQAWASQTGNVDNQKYKQEQRSSCAFSKDQEKKATPPPFEPTKHPPSTGKSMPQSKEEDPNEDWCAVCQNGGDLLCCDKCPKVFHLKCHVPELSQFPCGEWQCTLCKTEEEVVIKEKENKEFSYIPGTKRKAPTGLSEHERKTCERILLELYTHEKSTVFHEPVSKAVPNYYKIITNPIDFSKIKSKLHRQNFNHYDSIEEFIADVKLVFQNCATYNASTSEIGIAGKMVEEEFESLVQKYLPCYMDSYEEINHRQTHSPASDSEVSKAKKSKGYEHDPPVSLNLH